MADRLADVAAGGAPSAQTRHQGQEITHAFSKDLNLRIGCGIQVIRIFLRRIFRVKSGMAMIAIPVIKNRLHHAAVVTAFTNWYMIFYRPSR